jgi:molecular chaperone GrpE
MKTEVRKDDLNNEEEQDESAADGAAAENEAVIERHLSHEELQELETQAAKATEYWEQLLRTAADLENYKKRAAREKQDAIRYANESLLTKLIPVLDNFEMAAAAVSNTQGGASDSLQQGVSMIQQQLKQTLTEAGLEEINAAGQPFDPNCHEAVSQQETKEVPEGHVLQQLRKGYKLRDRLLRPATVIVAKAPGEKSAR